MFVLLDSVQSEESAMVVELKNSVGASAVGDGKRDRERLGCQINEINGKNRSGGGGRTGYRCDCQWNGWLG